MKLYLAIMAAACVCAVSGADLFDPEKKSDFANGNSLTVQKDVFSFLGNQGFVSAKAFPVNPAKKYKISVKVRYVNGKQPNCYIGFVPLDAKNNPIAHNSVDDWANTFTTLAAPLKKGDNFVKLKDASKWNKKTQYGNIAFGAKADYSDMPNTNLMKIASNGIVLKKDVWVVYLAKAATKDYPQGTAVRQQLDGGTYIYSKVSKLTNNWVELKGKISGIQKHGANNNMFWPGTKSVRVILLTNQGDQRTRVEFKDLEFDEDK